MFCDNCQGRFLTFEVSILSLHQFTLKSYDKVYMNTSIQLKIKPKLMTEKYPEPDNVNIGAAEICFAQGLAQQENKQYQAALLSYQRAAALKPDYAQAHWKQGNMLRQLGQQQAALACYQRAIELKPDYAEAYSSLGNTWLALRQYQAALVCYDNAISVRPEFAEAHNNRGIALQNLAQYDAALASFAQAIALKPDFAHAYNNRGLTLKALKRYDEELASYTQACTLLPDFAEAYNNRGNALQNLNRFTEATANYQQALALKPDYVSAAWNTALLKLLTGDFAEGFRLYESRWQKKDFDAPLLSRRPRWQPGCTVARLLIWAEQGVGDHIFFGGLFPEAAQWAEQLIAVVDARLLPLFAQAMPNIRFYPSNQPVPEDQYDAHLPMGSLPGYLRNSLSCFTQTRAGYLSPNQVRAAQIRQQLGGTDTFLIGIAWRSKNPQSGEKRTLDVNRFAMLSGPGVKLVNLQYGDVAADIVGFKTQAGCELLQCADVDNQQDLDGLAALITACDLVVSCDNSTVHLAGALGKACWVLLPVAPDWRWQLERCDSPWYQSIKLYRQETLDDWHQVMIRVKADLDHLRGY